MFSILVVEIIKNPKLNLGKVLIKGKHEERDDEHGLLSRQLTRRFVLPQEFDADTISTYLKAEGKMTIKAVKSKPQVDETKERVISTQHLAAVASES